MRTWPLLVLALLPLVGGCWFTDDPSSDARPYVVCTTGMVADAVARVGGDHIRVEGLMGPSVDPHLYKAGAADSRKLQEADAIFYNGLHLEGKMGDILTKMGRSKKVYALTEDVPEDRLRQPPEFEGLYDPHIWFDVSLWKEAVKKVEQGLKELDPPNAEAYAANAKAFMAELDELDAWVQQRISEIPEAGRILVTAHDAFGYFGARYGMEVRGLQGISTVSEYGTRDIEQLAQLLVDKRVKALFVESSVPADRIQAVLEGARSLDATLEVKVGGTLFSDAMGEPGTPEGTYLGMVRHNVNTIVEALK